MSIEVPASVTVDRVDAQHPVDASQVNVVVKHGDKTLENGVDYTLEFADNTAAGTAKVTVNGMGVYTGSVERSFEIKLADPVLEGIAVKAAPAKTIYKVGDKLDPAGLVLVLSLSNGTTREVAYGADTAAAFAFVPALDTVLDQENPALEVTVAYEGKTAVFDVRVEKAEDPKPEPVRPIPSPTPAPTPSPTPTPTLRPLPIRSSRAAATRAARATRVPTASPAPTAVLSRPAIRRASPASSPWAALQRSLRRDVVVASRRA